MRQHLLLLIFLFPAAPSSPCSLFCSTLVDSHLANWQLSLHHLHRDHGGTIAAQLLHFQIRFVGHPASALHNNVRAAQSDLRDFASKSGGRKAAAAKKAKVEAEKVTRDSGMMREEDARIAASATIATTAASGAAVGALASRKDVGDENDSKGEFPTEVANISLPFVGKDAEDFSQ